jgi:cell fate regulator YaaT (PSP1 superfamily)
MVKVIGVRFKKAGKVYYFDPGEYDIKKDDAVIVETVRGIEYGMVVVGPKEVPEEELVSPLKGVVRMADDHDRATHEQNQERAKEAFEACSAKISEHDLDMKLVEVEYTFDNNKVIFYFTADGRVDFRDLVKDLAAIFRTRIELRQIGVRDEAKMMNGIGPCGYKLCCATWLGDFVPVSIKMAKDQSLSLNPTKISGICGRLMCCLRYEYDTYRELNKELPKQGERVQTPDGMAIVYSTSILKEKVKVKLIVGTPKEGQPPELSDEFHEYGNSVILRVDKKRPKQDKKGCEGGNCPSKGGAVVSPLEDQEDEFFS